MNTFRCKQCGRLYEAVPPVCTCGNNSPSMWEIASPADQQTNGYPAPAAPAPQQPANNGWQQPAAAPAWQQPANGAPQQPAAAPAWQQTVPPAPQQTNGGGKKKNTALIAVIVVLVLILLGVGGYIVWQQFFADDPGSSAQEDDGDKEKEKDKDEEKDKDKDKDKNKETAGATEDEEETTAPAPTEKATEAPTEKATEAPTEAVTEAPEPANDEGTVTLRGVTLNIPAGFEFSQENDSAKLYMTSDRSERMMIGFNEISIGADTTMEDALKELIGESEETGVSNTREYTVNGHRALTAFVEHIGGTEGIDLLMVEVEDGAVIIEFYYEDVSEAANRAAIKDALSKVTVG